MINLWVILGVLAFLYVVFLFVVAWISLHPLRIPLFLTAAALGLPQRSVRFSTQDGVELSGWWIDHPNPHSVAVLSHGYVMNRAEGIPLAKRLHEEGFACLVYDARRHGFSRGKRSTIGYEERFDVAAAFAEAQKCYADRKVWGWGSSMGSVALILAQEQRLTSFSALVLDSPYRSLVEANDGWWRTFFGPRIGLLFRPVWILCALFLRVNPRKVHMPTYLSRLQDTPVLFMYGDQDLIVLQSAAEDNIAATPRAEHRFFSGCQHCQARWNSPEIYDATLFEFLSKNELMD